MLECAARWHCTPSEVLDQPYHPDLIYLADSWGVTPEKVLEEDAIWLARQQLMNKARAKAQ